MIASSMVSPRNSKRSLEISFFERFDTEIFQFPGAGNLTRFSRAVGLMNMAKSG